MDEPNHTFSQNTDPNHMSNDNIDDGHHTSTQNTYSKSIDGDADTAQAILHVLLNSPEDMERTERPSGIRENFACTFKSSIVSMESAKCDDNGAYIHKGGPRRWYHINDTECLTCHLEDDDFYINERKGVKYRKKFVNKTQVYELTRTYRQNKNNQNFVQMFATARRADFETPLRYYFMSYHWTDKEKEHIFVVSRHGNAKSPHASTYYRQNPSTKEKAVSLLQEGSSSGKVYRDLIQEAKVQFYD